MTKLYSWSKLKPIWQRAGVIHYPHQEQAAIRILHDMNGRGMLCDEVGLGKTIQAGLITFELIYRGQVNKILILVPAGLVGQWAEEMKDKFNVEFFCNPKGAEWIDNDRIIASLDLAKREENAKLLQIRSFDLIICDEAHKLKNANTRAHKFVRSLSSRYLLLLTASPVQNDLCELYNLASLVRPDLVGSYCNFQTSFMLDRKTPADTDRLRELLGKFMIRNRRRDVARLFPDRSVKLVSVPLSNREKEMYKDVVSTVRREFDKRRSASSNVLPLITLQKEICSSPAAALATLEKIDQASLFRYSIARDIIPSKAEYTLDSVRDIDDRILIFVEFRHTQKMLAEYLAKHGIDACIMHGGMTPRRRYDACRQFRKTHQVLISTECGGEGLNLQFCSNLINYDLPWNPMRIEQRIGRLHRLGQRRTVSVFNLACADTIEQHIVQILHEKLSMISKTVGQLEPILRQVDRRLDRHILQLYMTSDDDDAFSSSLHELAGEIASDFDQSDHVFDTI